MRTAKKWQLYLGIALVVVGIIGLACFEVVAGYYARATLKDDLDLLGRSIYLYGVDASGPIPIRAGAPSVRMMGGGCALCHGVDGSGGPVMMTGVNAPPISYSTLTSGLHEPDGKPYDPVAIQRAVTLGIDAEGELMNAAMPRWQLRSDDWPALLRYLKYLDRFGPP